jgi:hypothetical protein
MLWRTKRVGTRKFRKKITSYQTLPHSGTNNGASPHPVSPAAACVTASESISIRRLRSCLASAT